MVKAADCGSAIASSILVGHPMNIFVVDLDPKKAARDLCDRHVVKMTLESAQILSTVSFRHGIPGPYLPTHEKAPIVQWAGDTWGNWNWLVEHGIALANEYERRYGKIHKSLSTIFWCADHGGRARLVSGAPMTPFVQVMPEKYQGPDAVEAYRRFYRAEKARFATWKSPASPPDWWISDGELRDG